MTKRNDFLKICISLLLILSLMCAVGALTVFAEPEDGQDFGQDAVVDETPQDDFQPEDQQIPEEQIQPEEQVQPEEQPQPEGRQEPETPQEEQPQDNQWYDYIYSYDDADSSYEEPQYLGELPQADPEQVIEATAVPMPTVAVSDASLFSGIVMWLCVALGIAVIVGVLVSKRTRRRGV